MRQSIELILDPGLPPAFTKESYHQKCDVVCQHVFDSYYGQGRSVYGHAP